MCKMGFIDCFCSNYSHFCKCAQLFRHSINRKRYEEVSEGTKNNIYRKQYDAPLGKKKINPKGRNKRTVWRIAAENNRELHFASYPTKLIETPIDAGCPPNGIVLDPFMGSGTTAIVAKRLGRHYIGFEPNPDYVEICHRRLEKTIFNNNKTE